MDKQRDQIMREKEKRRADNKKANNEKKVLQKDIDYLHTWLDEMTNELNDAKGKAKQAIKNQKMAVQRKDCLDELATKQLSMIKDLKQKVRELSDSLADESQQRVTLERMTRLRVDIKKHRAIGQRGGVS